MKFLKEFWSKKKKDFGYLGYVLLAVYLSIYFSEFDKVQSDENLIKYTMGIVLSYILMWCFALIVCFLKLNNKKD